MTQLDRSSTLNSEFQVNKNTVKVEMCFTKEAVEIFKEDVEQLSPIYASAFAAGLDLKACIAEKKTIKPKEKVEIPTGVKLNFYDKNLVGLLFIRSSIGKEKTLQLANNVGVIDADYQGELKMIVFNYGDEVEKIEPKERFAQLVLMPIVYADLHRVDRFSEQTERAEGAFGSTNKQEKK